MIYLYAFLYVGFICLIGQIILDNTKLTAGHITALFVVLGVFLDTFDFYDKILDVVGVAASIPITSFGHSLVHAALEGAQEDGFLGLMTNMFSTTGAGIVITIVSAFVLTILFKPKN